MGLVTVEGFHPPSVRVLVVEGLGAEVADLQLVPVLHEVLKQKYQTVFNSGLPPTVRE